MAVNGGIRNDLSLQLQKMYSKGTFMNLFWDTTLAVP